MIYWKLNSIFIQNFRASTLCVFFFFFLEKISEQTNWQESSVMSIIQRASKQKNKRTVEIAIVKLQPQMRNYQLQFSLKARWRWIIASPMLTVSILMLSSLCPTIVVMWLLKTEIIFFISTTSVIWRILIFKFWHLGWCMGAYSPVLFLVTH